MILKRLTPDHAISAFDCGDSDLNEFLLEDSKHFLEKKIANTFILEDDGKIVAYLCLLNDKVSRLEITSSPWKRVRDSFPDSKNFRSYPSIKIGRFAVSVEYRGQHIGTELMTMVKAMLHDKPTMSAFRFITVDAYLSAIDFYTRNGFKPLTEKDANEHTRLMYFDMMELE